MNNAAGERVGKISLSVFGGAVTEMAPSDLPEGASPFNQDVDFLPGSVFTRGGRINVVSFANLFVEDLAGLAASLPGLHTPNEAAWINPTSATLNIPGTYAIAALNAGGTGSGTPLDQVSFVGGQTPTNASDSVTPQAVGEMVISYRLNSNTNPPAFGAPWTAISLNVNAIGKLGWQRVASTNPVTDSYAVPGTQAWAVAMASFGSSGNPTFNLLTSNNTNVPTTAPNIVVPANVGILVMAEFASNSLFTTNFTVSDGLGNVYVKLGDAIGTRPAGPQQAQITMYYCANSNGGTTTFNLGGSFSGSSIVWHIFTVTNLVALHPAPYSQDLNLTNFGFNIPATASISGVQVEVFGNQTTLAPDAILTANLIRPDGTVSSTSITGQLPLVDGLTTLGTAATGWSVPLTPALVNNPSFGVQLVASALGGETAVFSIYAVKLKVFITPSPPQNFNYLKTYEQTAAEATLALDSGGILWQEDPVNTPGVLNSIYTSILPNTFGKSVTFLNTEYIAFSDLLQGTDMPRQWTGTNLDRVSRAGPAAPPAFGTTSTGSSVVSITQNSPFLLPVFGGDSANNWLLVSSGPAAHGSFGTPATPGNVMTIILAASVFPPSYFKVGSNIVLTGFPSINGHTVNNDPTGVTNPSYYTITSVGSQIAGENSYDWITFQVPFTTFYNQHTPGGCSIQSTTATMTTAQQVPFLEVGNQFTLTGVSPAGWNNTFTVLQTPNASVLQIVQTSLTGNVAQYVFNLSSGSLPAVGQFVNVNGTLNGNGIFNVNNAVITSVTANTFTVSIQSPNVNAAAESNANGTIYGTVFVFDPAATVTNPIIGNGSGGSIATTGVIGVGIRKGVVFFITRNGAITFPSPYAQFNVTTSASAITATGIPIGGADVIARGIAFTGAGGDNFFYIPQPVTVISNGQQVTYSATIINDNVTTQATLSFPDQVLLKSTAIDVQGNNLFAQLELGSCRGFLTYADRLIAWGVQTKVDLLLNLSFDGGIGVQNLQQLATQPQVPTYPLGWTVDSVNGAGGQLLVSPLFGNSYYVKNSTGITKTLYGMITQPAFANQNGTPIIFPSTTYSARVTARCPSGAVTGNLVVDFFSPVLNQVFGSFSIPLSSMSSNFKIFTGTVITNPFGSTTGVAKDLQFRVYLSNVPNNGDCEIDRVEPFITNQPTYSTQFFASYAFNQEAFDGTTGLFGPAQNQQKANGGFVLNETLYMLKESSWYKTSDNGTTEPFKWNWREVSQKVGTIGQNSYDVGEGWAVTASRAGVYYFEGGEPIKISQEIQTLWELINWKFGHTIWLRNDEANKTIKVGVPLPTPNVFCPEFPVNANPTTPNVILSMSYRELNTGAQLASIGPIKSTFSGRLLSPEPARKWSFWNIACPYAELIDRGNNTKNFWYGTGYHDSKIFELQATQLSDDGLALNSFYVTHGFPKPEIAEAKGVDVLRSQFDYLLLNVSGTGTLNTYLYPEDTKNTPFLLDALPLDAVTQGNSEIPVNDTGNRYFMRFGTNAVGAGFALSQAIGIFTEDPWAPVRGSSRGSL